MTSRRDIETLQQRVYDAMRTLEELKKTPQGVSGDSWVFYRYDPRPAWDYEISNITDPTWQKLYKVTYQVPNPLRGFMNMLYEVGNYPNQFGIDYTIEPVGDDPYSYWLKVKHTSFNSDPAGVRLRFFVFSTQKGNLVITEQ